MALPAVLAEWLLFDTTRRLPAGRLLAYVAAVLVFSLWMVPGVVTRRLPMSINAGSHAMYSYQLALTHVLCGLPSRYNPKYHPALVVAKNDAAGDLPAPALLIETAGSVEQYCATSTVPYVNEDHSLGLLETSFLMLKPTLSLVEIGRWLSVVRVAIVTLFSAVLLSLGASVVFVAAISVVALAIFNDLQQAGMAYSTNTFFVTMVLLNVMACYGALRLSRSRHLAVVLGGAAAAGVVAAATVNMRSSYLPVFASFFVVYAIGVWRTRAASPSRWREVLLLAPAFMLGYLAFHYPLIVRPSRVGAVSDYTYHTVAHPLVLGLALPDNELARREGIKWVDEVGNSLARQVDPTTSYLLPGYEKAMLTYYGRLWQRYPWEMAGVYHEKLKLAGADMIHWAYFKDAWVPKAMWPLSWIRNGLLLFAVLGGMALAGFALFWRKGSGLAFCISLLGLAGALLYLESAIIVPHYYPQYQNYLLFVTIFASFLIYQLALNGAVSGIGWLLGSRREPRKVAAS